MTSALLLGATKGLGLELARDSVRRRIAPVIYGRSADQPGAIADAPQGATLHVLDLQIPDSVAHAPLPEHPVGWFFWIAGAFLKAPLARTAADDIDLYIDLHLRGPIQFLRRFLRHQAGPFNLVTIGSVSSWRLREDEALYCALKAAQAAFTRNLAVEMVRDRPGSRVTLVNPGGLNVPTFWEKAPQDLTGFLDAGVVARLVWDAAMSQSAPFAEIQVMRQKPVVPGSAPVVEYGPRCPEIVAPGTGASS
ncbi:SDR family NAD(P)-dependent oxidoreductase [Burkholderia pyrrocinia]|uniref:SDR family NAD(P)-dependent oxidoreductase n=1 Tax=Burkholderia pyrrocinia TaxID=60550 RepID=UPI0015884251|nr:SDR family oxidoreductase [Burkholderia pyrrocinia]